MAKAPKGTVSIASQAGMLRLRWRINGQPYTLPLGLADNPLHRRIAKGKAAQIQADIALERFDPTLKKYRQAENTQTPATIDLWAKFTEYRIAQGTKPATIDAKYKPIASNLTRFGRSIESPAQALAFITRLRSTQKPLIANQNLSLLKGFGDWLLSAGHWDSNHFAQIPSAKGAQSARPGNPFTRAEIKLILITLQDHPYYCHYHDVVMFLVHIGCRPSEAFMLRWHQINLTTGTVTIQAPKTDHEYTLDLQPKVHAMLTARSRLKPTDLVFPTPGGKQINPHNFRSRCWVTTIALAGIPYRPPYFSRHSMGSHLIDQGATYPQVAYALGHKSTRMVVQTYGRMLDRPKMPEF